MGVILRGGRIVTMNSKREILDGDLRFENSRISQVGGKLKAERGDEVIDVSGHFVIPGLIQAHTHLCQALFRGFADDLRLLDWLKKRIWPMESGHTDESIQASARIALAEMQLLGTTSILDMGTVHHTDALLAAAAESRMRYWGGKCLMDLKSASGPLFEPAASALKETEALIRRWHKTNDLIDYALCPRFAVSCTEKLLRACVELQEQYNILIHTHASESKEEISVIRDRTGHNNVDYFDHLGMLNPSTVVVHGVHLSAGELKKMVRAGTPLVHCPSSNLKLASGIAPIETYHEAGLKIGIGSDGAPCNNTMDPFLEMRLTALLQKPRFGPEALPAHVAFELATLGGARVLSREQDLGSLEAGKLADIVTVDRSHPSVHTVEDAYSALVYSCSGRDVCNVFIHGRPIVRDKAHTVFDVPAVNRAAAQERRELFTRAGLSR